MVKKFHKQLMQVYILLLVYFIHMVKQPHQARVIFLYLN